MNTISKAQLHLLDIDFNFKYSSIDERDINSVIKEYCKLGLLTKIKEGQYFHKLTRITYCLGKFPSSKKSAFHCMRPSYTTLHTA
jgi:hypothetical protein